MSSRFVGDPNDEIPRHPPSLEATGAIVIAYTPSGGMRGLRCDDDGNLITTTAGGGGGSFTPTDTTPNPTDTSKVAAFGMVYRQGGGFWERMGSQYMRSSASENVGVVSQGGVLTSACVRGVDDVSNQWTYIATRASDPALAVGGRHVTPAPSLITGDRRSLSLDDRGSLLVAVARASNSSRDCAPFFYVSGERSTVISSGPGPITGLSVSIGEQGELALYVCIVDKSTAPVDTDPVVMAFAMFPINGDDGIGGSTYYFPVHIGREFFSDAGINLEGDGIGVCISTTSDVVTLIPATANVTIAATAGAIG